jgi:hypothetical protein
LWVSLIVEETNETVTHVLFETGSDELRALEHKVFVAAGRFVMAPGKPIVVEYKISEVAI